MMKRTNYNMGFSHISAKQFNAILENVWRLHSDYDPEDIAFIFRLIYWCGLTVREAVHVHPQDLNIVRGTVWLGDTKRMHDHVTMPAAMVEHARHYLERRQQRNLADSADHPILGAHPGNVWRWWVKLTKAAPYTHA